jgi:hyperosmotically inducible protein
MPIAQPAAAACAANFLRLHGIYPIDRPRRKAERQYMKQLGVVLLIAALAWAPSLFAQNSVATNNPAAGSSAQQNSTAMPAQITGMNSNAENENRGLGQKGLARIVTETHHQLVMLPRYNVFDDLSYKVSPDGAVTLMGAVTDPTVKSDAESAVKRIEGVTSVVNNIQVLPPSPDDDRLRLQLYRAIYGNEVLSQYALRAVPPIHIIVNGGHVTLTGVVSTPMDKQIAEIQAKGVPGIFSVTDDQRVENQQKRS